MADMQKINMIQSETSNYIKKLFNIWLYCYGNKIACENLDQVYGHVKTYYNDLLDETNNKESYIRSAIEELKNEAESLARVLKTPFEFPNVNESLPLVFVQSEMDKSLENLREQLRLRREQICELLLEQEALCDELGETPRELLADPLPSEAEINAFRKYLDDLKELKITKMNQLCTIRREIKAFLQILELNVSTNTEDRLLNHREIDLNPETFNCLQKMHDSYRRQVEELQVGVDELRKKVNTLWDRLGTSPNTRKKIMRNTSEYNQSTYDIYYGELQRCEVLRGQNIKKFVKQVREEIAEYWDKCFKSDTQRNRFVQYRSEDYNDDLLALHEMELDHLKNYYENNEDIFQLFNDRKMMWDRMIALEAKANEPGRFNNRGGQLLKEEKERKTIATKLPKIERQIADYVTKYESIEQKPFLVYGENILHYMSSEWEKKREAKEKLSTTRKNSKTPLNKGMSSIRTPLSMKNMSTMSSASKLSTAKNHSKVPMTTSQKRKLEAKEQFKPAAKRSLMAALNSPSVFRVPAVIVTAATPGLKTPYSASKSIKKPPRVIATTIRRQSGNHKAAIRKRLSQGKNRSKVAQTVQNNENTNETRSDENFAYENFQKCIEPDSRSSIIQHNSTLLAMYGKDTSSNSSNVSKRTLKRKKVIAENIEEDEEDRLAYLPNPRLARTPSKQNIHSFAVPKSPHRLSPTAVTFMGATSSRKLTTKNLPIII